MGRDAYAVLFFIKAEKTMDLPDHFSQVGLDELLLLWGVVLFL